MPSDNAWDERCRGALFLTDCEVVTDTTGTFRAHSLLGSVNYAVEVLREGNDRELINYYSRGQKDKVRLEVAR